jgi:hypothetical protein
LQRGAGRERRADVLVFGELGVKVDALDADELETVVDEGRTELVCGQLYTEEEGGAGFGYGGHLGEIGLKVVS